MSLVNTQLKKDPLMPMRHSCEHVLHTVIQILYPNIKLVMGPPIENGFYMDVDLNSLKVSSEDFPKIEELMKQMIKADLPITGRDAQKGEIEQIYKNNQYKLDTLKEIADRGEKATIFEVGTPQDKFYNIDLCAGPHVSSTGKIKAFKLLSVAGAYYKGSEKNKMLTRIYGTAFDSQKDLDNYLFLQEEAKRRDHRKLGKDLDLFTFSEEVGPGLVLWTPKGTVIRDELENWAKQMEQEQGYKRVSTPHIAKHTLFEISGHLPYYKDDMYQPMLIDEEEYYLKAMNCPHHHMIYNSSPKSYRDLPLRYAEYGMVYRYENSGSLFGLMRVRGLCQNDSHIYCTEDQAEEEFFKVLELHDYYYKALGLTKEDYYIVVGLPSDEKKDKYHGNKELWDKSEKIMRRAIKRFGVKAIDDIGGAAFYGPKIDINIRSSIGREFSISTCQLDLYMPTRFDLSYTDTDGSKKLCAVIHRAPLGSHERFIGFLIEHFAGAFPVWLSPVQAVIIPIAEKHNDYAQKLQDQLTKEGLRAELNNKNDTMQSKIRDAQMQKVPYMLVVGDKEEQAGTVSVRLRDNTNIGAQPLDQVISKIKDIYLTKSLKLW